LQDWLYQGATVCEARLVALGWALGEARGGADPAEVILAVPAAAEIEGECVAEFMTGVFDQGGGSREAAVQLLRLPGAAGLAALVASVPRDDSVVFFDGEGGEAQPDLGLLSDGLDGIGQMTSPVVVRAASTMEGVTVEFWESGALRESDYFSAAEHEPEEEVEEPSGALLPLGKAAAPSRPHAGAKAKSSPGGRVTLSAVSTQLSRMTALLESQQVRLARLEAGRGSDEDAGPGVMLARPGATSSRSGSLLAPGRVPASTPPARARAGAPTPAYTQALAAAKAAATQPGRPRPGGTGAEGLLRAAAGRPPPESEGAARTGRPRIVDTELRELVARGGESGAQALQLATLKVLEDLAGPPKADEDEHTLDDLFSAAAAPGAESEDSLGLAGAKGSASLVSLNRSIKRHPARWNAHLDAAMAHPAELAAAAAFLKEQTALDTAMGRTSGDGGRKAWWAERDKKKREPEGGGGGAGGAAASSRS